MKYGFRKTNNEGALKEQGQIQVTKRVLLTWSKSFTKSAKLCNVFL